MSLMRDGIKRLFGMMQDFAEMSTYSRGGESIKILAHGGKCGYRMGDGSEVDGWKFVVVATELNFGNGVFLPEDGDVITDHHGQRFLVASPGDGFPLFVFDSSHVVLSIYVALIGS